MCVWRSSRCCIAISVTTSTGRARCSHGWLRPVGWARKVGEGSMTTGADLPIEGLSDTQRQVMELAREFAREHIEPRAAEWDRTKEFPRGIIDELGKLGFLGMTVPQRYDGM